MSHLRKMWKKIVQRKTTWSRSVVSFWPIRPNWRSFWHFGATLLVWPEIMRGKFWWSRTFPSHTTLDVLWKFPTIRRWWWVLIVRSASYKCYLHRYDIFQRYPAWVRTKWLCSLKVDTLVYPCTILFSTKMFQVQPMRLSAVHDMMEWLKMRGIPRRFKRTLSCVIETDTWVTLKLLLTQITSNDVYQFSVLAKIILFPYAPENAVYESCPNKDCKKKVTQNQDDYSYHCEKCEMVGRSFTVRYKLKVSSCFDSHSHNMFNIIDEDCMKFTTASSYIFFWFFYYFFVFFFVFLIPRYSNVGNVGPSARRHGGLRVAAFRRNRG